MADLAKDVVHDLADDGVVNERQETVERVAEDVRDDVEHGRVTGDTAVVLEERLAREGVELRPESVDSLAEDIEEDVSR